MALNVGPDFKQRWLNAPQAVRQAFIDDLTRITDVLHPTSQVDAWLLEDEKQQLVSEQKVIQAYTELKAQLVEEARLRRQQALEQALNEKRVAEQAYIEQLKQDELNRFHAQTEQLANLREHLQDEIALYTAKYRKNPQTAAQRQTTTVHDRDLTAELENVRIRLELEAEIHIEHAVIAFKAKLKAAALEEIDYILKQAASKHGASE